MFCTNYPHQRTVGKLRFNKGGKYKLNFLLEFLGIFNKSVAKLGLLSKVTRNMSQGTYNCRNT